MKEHRQYKEQIYRWYSKEYDLELRSLTFLFCWLCLDNILTIWSLLSMNYRLKQAILALNSFTYMRATSSSQFKGVLYVFRLPDHKGEHSLGWGTRLWVNWNLYRHGDRTVVQDIVVPKILTSDSTFPHCQAGHKWHSMIWGTPTCSKRFGYEYNVHVPRSCKATYWRWT